MIEIELADIEDRIPTYPKQAQADIRWLVREVRKLYNLGSRHPEPPAAAIYDALTGLLSGGAYGVRFAMARARAGRNKKMFAVMSIDVPVGKRVAAGKLSEQEAEETLKQIALRLTACVRETDTVARIDHEKFAVILEDLAAPDNAERVKQKVGEALAQPINLGKRSAQAESKISLQFYQTSRPAGTSLH